MDIGTIEASELAKRENLPTGESLTQLRFFVREGVTTIELGDMIASIMVVPVPEVTYAMLTVYDGDAEIISSLKGEYIDSTLKLSADLPFKPGHYGHNAVFGMTIIDGHTTISSSDSYMIHGREVDLTRRPLHCVLEVPVSMSLAITGLLGGIGIVSHLNGTLTLRSSSNTTLAARSVRSLNCSSSGRAKIAIGRVVEDAYVNLSGRGVFTASSINGAIKAQVTSHGEITIAGGISSGLTAFVSGRGSINHFGTVAGPTHASVTGRGSILVHSTDDRDLEVSVTGRGSAMINDTTYTRN